MAMPRAPKLERGTCIATAALVESAQRVFMFHSNEPIHWLDLCTLMEAVVIHDKIAIPIIYREYAEPLLEPLTDAGVIDPWWPEMGLFNGPAVGSKEELWNEYDDNALRMPLLLGGWPDTNFDSLSPECQEAVDGIARGFGEVVLLQEESFLSLMMWGPTARSMNTTEFETAALSQLRKGISDLRNLTPEERSQYSTPHQTDQDIYNHYAQHLRALANNSGALLIRSLVEEPFFDAVSAEEAAKNTLYTLLNERYAQDLVSYVKKYVRVIPSPPFAGIAFSRANSTDDLLKIALDMREEFAEYRQVLRSYRELQNDVINEQTPNIGRELDKLERLFSKALDSSFAKIDRKYEMKEKWIFDGMRGAKALIFDLVEGDRHAILERAGGSLLSLIKDWQYLNYGGLFTVVKQLPDIPQIAAASQKLTGHQLSAGSFDSLSELAQIIEHNYGLMALRQQA